ncbi:unnamed protein product [Lepeophtheirus salmonis]|uniref:(salmon louse) hypothetical protein n=1 Tax=Lepeophtheirus salmonis TaxID=72036 RepID=A0A7R8HCA4_LEPSM|nr:unnamed protein product [Lepeophtheirus salmonis]CAF3009347.1 unnamed protein product [Lepeophtheirus salmonis]
MIQFANILTNYLQNRAKVAEPTAKKDCQLEMQGLVVRLKSRREKYEKKQQEAAPTEEKLNGPASASTSANTSALLRRSWSAIASSAQSRHVGKKQVGAVTSGEKGQLVNVLCAVNAGGSAVPPFYVFPRAKVNPAFLNGALSGAEATATKSSWMNSEIFSNQYLPFFIRQTRCSKDHQVLLIMDNHESHVSLKAITTAKDCNTNIASRNISPSAAIR